MDQIQSKLEPIPELTADPVWTLADVVGTQRANQIQQSGAISFHAVGDTGAGKFPVHNNRENRFEFGGIGQAVAEAQTEVARAMNKELNPSLPGATPAFFFHLGDVIYFDNTAAGYHEQFYAPYVDYDGKIIAIPGNHDGEVLLGHQPSTCLAFMRNFCPPHPLVPPDADPVIREMSAQPNVYWWLQAPFLDLIGLYSNCAEGPGFLRGAIPGEHQYEWFKSALQRIAGNRRDERKALVVAMHHPPLTAKIFDDNDPGHSPSDHMRDDLEAAFKATGVWPDAVLSAHVHNYQRFTRRVDNQKVTYVIAGGGGRQPQKVLDGQGQTLDDGSVTFERSHGGHGYLTVSANPDELRLHYRPIPAPDPDNRDDVVIRF
jgi:hypothetical protein